MTPNYKFTFTFTAPRWANAGSFIRDYCFMNDINGEVTTHRGWIRNSYRVKITGNYDEIERAVRDIIQALEDYNA